MPYFIRKRKPIQFTSFNRGLPKKSNVYLKRIICSSSLSESNTKMDTNIENDPFKQAFNLAHDESIHKSNETKSGNIVVGIYLAYDSPKKVNAFVSYIDYELSHLLNSPKQFKNQNIHIVERHVGNLMNKCDFARDFYSLINFTIKYLGKRFSDINEHDFQKDCQFFKIIDNQQDIGLQLGNQIFNLETILSKFIETLLKYFNIINKKVVELCICVPKSYHSIERLALKEALELIGVRRFMLISIPIALTVSKLLTNFDDFFNSNLLLIDFSCGYLRLYIFGLMKNQVGKLVIILKNIHFAENLSPNQIGEITICVKSFIRNESIKNIRAILANVSCITLEKSLQKQVKSIFTKYNIDLITNEKELAVNSALLASQKKFGIQVNDLISLKSIGICLYNGILHKIIDSSAVSSLSLLPLQIKHTFKTVFSNQNKIRLLLYEGVYLLARYCRLIGEIIIAPSGDMSNLFKCEFIFKYDKNGILSVSAYDTNTLKELETSFNRKVKDNPKEIRQLDDEYLDENEVRQEKENLRDYDLKLYEKLVRLDEFLEQLYNLDIPHNKKNELTKKLQIAKAFISKNKLSIRLSECNQIEEEINEIIEPKVQTEIEIPNVSTPEPENPRNSCICIIL